MKSKFVIWCAALTCTIICSFNDCLAKSMRVHCVQQARHVCELGKSCRALQDDAPNQWIFDIDDRSARVQRCAGKECGDPFQAVVNQGPTGLHLWEPIANETFAFTTDNREFAHASTRGVAGSYIVSEFGSCMIE
jgi:hypothetical protein